MTTFSDDAFPAGGGMTLLSRTVIDVSGSFTLDARTKWFRVICMGGGAGGRAAYDPYGGYFNGDSLPGLGGLREWEDFAASIVTGAVTITIGAGGAAGYRGPDLEGYSNEYPPTAGGNTSFGNLLVGLGGQPAPDPSNTPYVTSIRISSNTAHLFVGSRRLLLTPIVQSQDTASAGNQWTIPEGEGPFYQFNVASSNSYQYMANSWGGNRGGVGRYYTNNGAWSIGAGRCFPDPLAGPRLLVRGATAPANGNLTGTAGPAGIGDYPGGGGSGSGAVNGKGGFPSGGGAGDAGGGAGPGAAGRVIIYQWG